MLKFKTPLTVHLSLLSIGAVDLFENKSRLAKQGQKVTFKHCDRQCWSSGFFLFSQSVGCHHDHAFIAEKHTSN